MKIGDSVTEGYEQRSHTEQADTGFTALYTKAHDSR